MSMCILQNDEFGFVRPRLRVRSRPMDFHDTENRQRPCHMIIRHVKDPLSALGKIKFQEQVRIVRCLPLGTKLSLNITCGH
ncbi:hypothetical protein TNCV_1167201 [Trichonephila clavipes]|uniref:Uncharacterized protein n=1 Tax=Trichonephila clavipes TaxID=2585209 RepID=A0A8X6VT88_TRICX|nr:hypothetical protein TNCV_1167201 [Trichonephila clavipes]